MKKILIALVILVMTMPVMAQEKPLNNMVFGGFNHDGSSVPIVGVGFSIPNTPLYEFAYTTLGVYGSLQTETGWMFDLGEIYFAPIAGPGISWQEVEPSAPNVYYLTGSSGLIAGVDFTDKVGVWAYGKYKFDFDGENYFQNGYAYGAGLFVRF